LAASIESLWNFGFLASSSHNKIGVEARRYIPVGDRITLAAHAYIQYTPAGNETPFGALPGLGGDDSVIAEDQTLRGYGSGRLRHNNLVVFNLECRTRVCDRNIFDTHLILELAPFFEAGRVYRDFDENPVSQFHRVGGSAFAVSPSLFVVAYVDVGVGGHELTIFSGVNYPF
jgi:hypothetical protein